MPLFCFTVYHFGGFQTLRSKERLSSIWPFLQSMPAGGISTQYCVSNFSGIATPVRATPAAAQRYPSGREVGRSLRRMQPGEPGIPALAEACIALHTSRPAKIYGSSGSL
jgi:hypothetical protein